MEIADNGPGQISNENKGFGKSLIDGFTRQLHATCQVTNDHGLMYRFQIPYTRQKNCIYYGYPATNNDCRRRTDRSHGP